MREQSTRALKIIAALGVLTFIFLLLASLALRKSLGPDTRQRVRIRQQYSPFDAKRALEDIEAIVELGPRPPGSEAAAGELAHIAKELTAAGVSHTRIPLPDENARAGAPNPEEADAAFDALVADVQGTESEKLLLVTGYGTPVVRAADFVGAHATASGSAWLLELARTQEKTRKGYTLLLAWVPETGPPDNEKRPPGGDLLAKAFAKLGVMNEIAAVLEVDAIGDCYLQVRPDANAPEWLWGIVRDTARRLGYRHHFTTGPLDNAHHLTALRQAGLPALALRDAFFGGSALAHNDLWHTGADTLDKVCPASLQAIADVFYHALPAIEGHLTTRERAR